MAGSLMGSMGVLCLTLAGCDDINWPYHHHTAAVEVTPGESGAADNAAECATISAEIKDSEETRREAPTTTTESDIRDAAEGKADKRIDDLRQRYDAMDCPPDNTRPTRQPPLQPAPGGGNR